MNFKFVLLIIVIIIAIIFIINLKQNNKNDKNTKENTISKKDIDYSKCIEIARIISQNDENVIKEIEQCVSNPDLYYKNNESEYTKRFILDSNNKDKVIWIGMVNCLMRNNYACECDWKDELDNFINCINKMNYNVTLGKENLNENGNVSEWCIELDEQLQKENMCIGGIDIDSDSYIMFICERNKLEKLNELAQSINHKITLASKL